MFCDWIVTVTRRHRRPEGHGTWLGTRRWLSTCGRVVEEDVCRPSSGPIGKAVRHCTFLVIVQASPDTTTGAMKCHPKSGVRRTGSFNIWRSSMNFSIAGTICRLLVPRHRLSCSWFLWRRLCRKLRERGQNRSRESGAFLLGHRRSERARIVDFVLYDDLDPCCLDSGIVRFDGRYFGDLWAICKTRGLTVIADVHVHPGGAGQSTSDRMHPMISCNGHTALILPRFGVKPLPRREIGIYRYRGRKQWTVVPATERRSFFHIGF